MPIQINPATNKPYKLLIFGDVVVPSGFGRISNEVGKRLKQRGYEVQGAGISYSGWPHNTGFDWVWPLANQDIWGGLVAIVNSYQPDMLISIQDFPYHHNIWHACRIDFSRVRWVWITPIDGTPVHPDWVKLADYSDGGMVISRFGVEAMRQAGKRVELCHPGVDVGEFYPAEGTERNDFRAKAGFGPDDFIVGVMCMNQGRKAIPKMVEAFGEFARDKPNARLLLDMDRIGPGGWDVPKLLVQLGWSEQDQARVKFKEDLFKADMATFAPLRNRYAMLDAHMVISHREGFGLPLLESMACRVPTLALDWCSGTEICGEGRGVLIPRIDYMEHGTWGGARDAFPDMGALVDGLNRLYNEPGYREAVSESGYQWAIKQSWDVATDQVETVIQAAFKRARTERKQDEPKQPANAASPGLSDTYGPGTAVAVNHHPGPQPSQGGDPTSTQSDGHLAASGPDGGSESGDPRTGRRKPRRKPVRDIEPAGAGSAQPDQSGV